MLCAGNEMTASFYMSRTKKIGIELVLFAIFLGLWVQDSCGQQNTFGKKFPNLESRSTGKWWEKKPNKRFKMNLDVARENVIAFALYTHDHGMLKLSAQLYPLKSDEDRTVRLEFRQRDGSWKEVDRQPVQELGWSAHFRIASWDNSVDQPYRVRHGSNASFEGLIRKDPIEKNEIIVGSLSCNSSRTPGSRPRVVENLKQLNPDLLFFAGDQTYHHTEHTLRLAGIWNPVSRHLEESPCGDHSG